MKWCKTRNKLTWSSQLMSSFHIVWGYSTPRWQRTGQEWMNSWSWSETSWSLVHSSWILHSRSSLSQDWLTFTCRKTHQLNVSEIKIILWGTTTFSLNSMLWFRSWRRWSLGLSGWTIFRLSRVRERFTNSAKTIFYA